MTDGVLQQIHLTGRAGYSGRAVRYRTLTAAQVERNEIEASKSVEKDSPAYVFVATVQKLGLEQMIVQVSEPVKPDKLGEAAWRDVSPEQLIGDGWKALFTVKDTEVLKRLYNDEYYVTKDEVDAILSGKVQVLAD